MRRIAFAIALAAASAHALAQGYPSKPITFVIPFAAGGDSDLSGRNVAQHASKYLNNQPIVPVNRVGASGVIGASAVQNAPADGYTLLVARIATHAIVPALDSKVPYKWNEFTMLSLIELNPYICFVKGDSPYRTAADLIAAIRAQPGKLNFSTAGVGTSQNMAAQYLMTLAGLTTLVCAGRRCWHGDPADDEGSVGDDRRSAHDLGPRLSGRSAGPAPDTSPAIPASEARSRSFSSSRAVVRPRTWSAEPPAELEQVPEGVCVGGALPAQPPADGAWGDSQGRGRPGLRDRDRLE